MSKQTVRTTVEGHVFAELQAQADLAGISLFLHLRQILTAHVEGAVAPEPTLPGPTPDEWRALRAWVQADPTRLAGYSGPKKFDNPAARAEVYIWAQAHGYAPA